MCLGSMNLAGSVLLLEDALIDLEFLEVPNAKLRSLLHPRRCDLLRTVLFPLTVLYLALTVLYLALTVLYLALTVLRALTESLRRLTAHGSCQEAACTSANDPDPSSEFRWMSCMGFRI